MVNKEFISLCSKAWSIQILSYMHQQNDPRISPITHHFSASRTSISAALQHLVGLGYVRKNTGHGHPLRPAYALTTKGKSLGAWAAELDQILNPVDWGIARRTWVLPVLREMSPVRRYGELRSKLHPVTDRALSETLKKMGTHNWLDRCVDIDSSPPSVTYTPQGTGLLLVPAMKESLSI
ncbi:MAG: winged helix-turn-helix transcriptional regulator [Granulosicoccus sp.]